MSNTSGLIVDRGALPRLAMQMEARAAKLRDEADTLDTQSEPERASVKRRRAQELERRARNHRVAASRGIALVTEGDGNV